MIDSDRSEKFRGIIPPMITPLRDRDALDESGHARLVEHLIEGGVQGIFILGTSGEAPSLSYRLRRELITRTCELAAGRVPVLVGITDTAYVESLQLAEVAAVAGAEAVVLTTPYYFPAGQTELLSYVNHVLTECPLPVMLYNMPAMTKVWFEPATLRELTARPEVIGMKDSSGDWDYFQQVLELKKVRPDWSVLIGPEHLLIEAMQAGADGGVAGGANLFPTLFVQAFEAACRDDQESMAALQARIDQLQEIYAIGKYASRYIKALKSALSILGICSDFMAEPFHKFLPPERQRVQQVLDSVQAQLAATQIERV